MDLVLTGPGKGLIKSSRRRCRMGDYTRLHTNKVSNKRMKFDDAENQETTSKDHPEHNRTDYGPAWFA